MSEQGTRSRHPWHPALVHFPIACWMLGAALHLLVSVAHPPGVPGIDFAALAAVLLWAGNAFALPAVIAGLVDYARLPAGIQDGTNIRRHMTWMGSAWILFLCAAVASANPWSLAAELAGAACLVAGGLTAARVVFEEWPAARTGATESPAKRSAPSA